MSEEASEIVKADETPEPEDPKEPQEEVTAEPKPSRVKITEVAKQMTECSDCKKPMNMKTLRYSHPDKCEGKPSDIMSKPVRKNKMKPKVKAKPLSVENNEEIRNVPVQQQPVAQLAQAKHQVPPPVSKAMPPPPPPNMQPYDNLTQAQLMQLQLRTMNQEMMRRRQEKANNMCQAMFNSRSKKSR